MGLIGLYRVIFAGRRPCCRYIPTCSEYALDAIKKYGAIKGGTLACVRLSRCRPGFGKDKKYGYDPIK
jgi:putative membrane protein insertion efficiency factor